MLFKVAQRLPPCCASPHPSPTSATLCGLPRQHPTTPPLMLLLLQRLVTEALTRGSHDNLTALVAFLPRALAASGGRTGGAERVFHSAAAASGSSAVAAPAAVARRHVEGGRRERVAAPAMCADEARDTY